MAIIGAGPLGRWLALSAARAGYRVLLEDVMPSNLHHAQEFLREELGPELRPESSSNVSGDAKAGSVRQGQTQKQVLRLPLATLGVAQDDSIVGVTCVSTIEEAVREADLAIDCVPDELESKLEILWLLDRMAPPRTVFAVPTTRLSIADLANCTYRPAQCVAIVAEAKTLAGRAEAGDGNHAAEADGAEILLRTTSKTSAESVALVRGFWERLGFRPRFELDPAEQPTS
ncbi:MAG: 3-hydroxyacyl-CoA dehydrogenase NAD-binding domain-containing protein [Terriglobia bacterium]